MKRNIVSFVCFSVLFLSGCVERGNPPSQATLNDIPFREVEIDIQNNTPNSVSLDLDDENFVANNSSEDIEFTLSEKGFVVIRPVNGTTGVYLKTLTETSNEYLLDALDECKLLEDKFINGTKPLTSIGDTFCWKTEDHVIAITIESFLSMQNEIKIKIKYTSIPSPKLDE